MARPKFLVQHFIAARRVEWEGPAGPNTARTLEGVIHVFGVPSGSEPDFVFEELWLYARLFRTNAAEGTRDFELDVVWIDAPGGGRVIETRPLTAVRFTNLRPTANVAWPLRPARFPGLGLYEFRLRCWVQPWSGPTTRVVAREFIRIERMP